MAPSLKKTILEGVVVGGAGFSLGTLFGTQLDKLIHPIPSDVQLALDRLRFHDVPKAIDLVQGTILSYGEEGSWHVWNIAYGLPDYVSNDVIVDLGFNTATGEVSCSIAKLAHDAVQVYKDETLLVTLQPVTGADTVIGAYVATMLREPTV